MYIHKTQISANFACLLLAPLVGALGSPYTPPPFEILFSDFLDLDIYPPNILTQVEAQNYPIKTLVVTLMNNPPLGTTCSPC